MIEVFIQKEYPAGVLRDFQNIKYEN